MERFASTTVFWIVWLTTFVVLLIFGDFNLYTHFPDGRVLLKQRADILERIVYSVMLGGLVGVVNLLLLHLIKKVHPSNGSTSTHRHRRVAP
jgi:hypothetical protein